MKQKRDSRIYCLLSIRKVMVVLLLFFFTFTSTAQKIVYVGGNLNSDRIWSSDSVYIVVQDFRVTGGITLTIPPGTVIKVVQNRAIYIDGVLHAGSNDGGVADSVYFMSNSDKKAGIWRWKGLIFKNSLPQDSTFLFTVSVTEAENAIEMTNCRNITIKNSTIFGNRQGGILLTDCKNCSIVQCNITGNYDGIEMQSTILHNTSANVISNNFLSNENHNIYLYRNTWAVLNNNSIENNIIEGGNNGIWLDNAGESGQEQNSITRNIFNAIGENAGYALFISNDSTEVKNNLFLNNYIAIYCEHNAADNLLSYNSFYQNIKGIILNRGATANRLIHNTFALQTIFDVDFSETTNLDFSNNNLFYTEDAEKQVINETNEDFIIANNFWNTNSDSSINKLLWDKEDNPALGKFYYKPTLIDADTSNPIAPPYCVKKQWINNKTKLSWPKNIEKDVAGYRVYWGKFDRYVFDHQFDVGFDTLFSNDSGLITDKFAVTAYDFSGKTIHSQLSGHESPYAIALLYPYAGQDSMICKYQTVFQITESNIPFSHHQVLWSTTGDGTFNNNKIIRPKYFPGTEDIQKGRVILHMRVQKSTGEWRSDAFCLTLLNNPTAFAGNDTLVINSDSIHLVEATASNFSSVVWQTNGDGRFLNDTVLNTFYTLGTNDLLKGVTTLYLYVFSKCGYSVDSLQLTTIPSWQVSGTLWLNNERYNNAVVLSKRQNDTLSRSLQITSVQPDGSFQFGKLIQGNYYLYAVPDTNNTDDAVPTYYAGNIRWQQAYVLPVYASTYDVDIRLKTIDFSLPQGEASISGHFSFPPSFNRFAPCFQSWFTDNQESDTLSEGLPNATVLLYNAQREKLFRYTLTNSSGDFIFSHLPYGQYIVDAELTGYETVPSAIINLSPANKHVSGIHLEINQKKIIVVSFTTGQQSNLLIYPNPVTDVLHLLIHQENETPLLLKIWSVQGRYVFEHQYCSQEIANGNLQIPEVKVFPSGIYVGMLSAGSKTTFFKILKK